MLSDYVTSGARTLGIIYVVCLLIAPFAKQRVRWKQWALASSIAAAGMITIASMYDKRAQDSSVLYCVVHVMLGAVGASVTSFISLWTANFRWSTGLRHWKESYRLVVACRPNLVILSTLILAACTEELLWRCILQSWMGNGVVAIAVTTSLFCGAHLPQSRKVRLPRLLDVASFSLVAGILYAATDSIIVIFVAHSLKNYQLLMLRYRLEPHYRTAIETSVQKALLKLQLGIRYAK
jgi:membrane protease YdiL (CAAX protease family)